jgi:hypothetical protein
MVGRFALVGNIPKGRFQLQPNPRSLIFQNPPSPFPPNFHWHKIFPYDTRRVYATFFIFIKLPTGITLDDTKFGAGSFV